jgi:hypothetical protein
MTGRSVALAFLLAGPAFAQRASLDKIVAAYTHVRGFQVVAAVTNRIAGGDPAYGPNQPALPGAPEETVAYDYAAPDHWRLQDSSSGSVQVLLGENHSFVHPSGLKIAPRDAVRHPIPPKLMNYRTVKLGSSSNTNLRQEEVTLGTDRIPCTVIEVRYPRDTPSQGWGQNLNRRQVMDTMAHSSGSQSERSG